MEIKGYNVMTGAFGTLHFDGDPIVEVEEVSVDVEIQRGDIQINLDVDAKMTGTKGSGSFKVKHVYTRYLKKWLDAYKKGHDVRSVLSVAINDPDSPGGQRERVNIGNVWFNKLQMGGFNKSEVVGREFEFGFTVSDSDIAEGVY